MLFWLHKPGDTAAKLRNVQQVLQIIISLPAAWKKYPPSKLEQSLAHTSIVTPTGTPLISRIRVTRGSVCNEPATTRVCNCTLTSTTEPTSSLS